MNEIENLQNQIDELKQIIDLLVKPDTYTFERPLKGGANGLKIALKATDKMAFHGATPVVQNVFIVAPTGGATIDGVARGIINDIRNLLIAKGLMEAS